MADKFRPRRPSINLPSVITLSNFLHDGHKRKKHVRISEAPSHLRKSKPRRASDSPPRSAPRPPKHLFKSMEDLSSGSLVVPERPKNLSKSSGPMSNRKTH